MKVLILSDNTTHDELGESIRSKLLGSLAQAKEEIIHYDVGKENLKYCLGCFGCWLKTPGICVLDDIGREIADTYVKSDIVIVVSSMKYGCYSVSIRRTFDRLIPNVLPFFKKVNGEVHHRPRYEKYPQIIVIGYAENSSDFEIETFKSLTDANAVNFQNKAAKTYFCKRMDAVDGVINSLELYLKEKQEVKI